MARKPVRKAKTQKKKAVKRAVPRKAGKAKRASAPKRRASASKAKRPSASKGRRPARKAAPVRPKPKAKATSKKVAPRKKARRQGGNGRESTLAQTPATGRTVTGRTNPMPTKRSTGTPAGAGDARRIPGLERERRQLREVEESLQTPPSSLNMDRHGSAARSGRAAFRHAKKEHTETSPAMTGGDVDADWEDAYAVGDEAPGGDNPTPDQDIVDEIGAALGVTYQDDEELKAADKIIERDRHRWELDPASAEDYKDHDKD
jgi:Family of unknown function (DUF6335)